MSIAAAGNKSPFQVKAKRQDQRCHAMSMETGNPEYSPTLWHKAEAD